MCFCSRVEHKSLNIWGEKTSSNRSYRKELNTRFLLYAFPASLDGFLDNSTKRDFYSVSFCDTWTVASILIKFYTGGT
jgi:hypothetical protein